MSAIAYELIVVIILHTDKLRFACMCRFCSCRLRTKMQAVMRSVSVIYPTPVVLVFSYLPCFVTAILVYTSEFFIAGFGKGGEA